MVEQESKRPTTEHPLLGSAGNSRGETLSDQQACFKMRRRGGTLGLQLPGEVPHGSTVDSRGDWVTRCEVPAPRRMLGNISGLHSLDVSSTLPQAVTTTRVSKTKSASAAAHQLTTWPSEMTTQTSGPLPASDSRHTAMPGRPGLCASQQWRLGHSPATWAPKATWAGPAGSHSSLALPCQNQKATSLPPSWKKWAKFPKAKMK